MPYNKLNLYLFQGEWYRFTLSSKPPRQAKGKVGGLRASVDNILIDLLNSSYPSYPSSFPGYLTRVVDFQIRSSIGCYNKTILIFNYFVFLLECYISFRSRCASLNKSEDGAYAFSRKTVLHASRNVCRSQATCMVYSLLSRLQSPIFP